MSLKSISPIDGRYAKQTEALSSIFSEMGLMRSRIIVEGEYLIALSELKLKLRKLSDKEKKLIRSLYNLSESDAKIISDIERKGHKDIPATNHDVKAVEYFIKLKLANTSLKDVLEWIHFALTSEDTNNLAYGLMLKNGLADVILPSINEIIFSLTSLSQKHKDLPMLARTHGQSASPTTFGKELRVFKERLLRQATILKSQKILCKLNGATGNYNAHLAAYPKVDWLKFSQKFIDGLNKLSTNNLALRTELDDRDESIGKKIREA
ncbi:MAG TPA: lyase family protein, partial [Candidatus Limnocylindria bacterium]|nr:lyase family protein [Candidatus Limnocylindria bacterium]